MVQDKLDKVKKLAEFSQELGISLPVLSITWCIKNPNVTTAILGATRKDQLIENLKAIEFLPKITAEIISRVDEIAGSKPVQPEY